MSRVLRPALPAVVSALALAMAAAVLWLLLAPALLSPGTTDYDPVALRLTYSTLPRLATALMAGVALSVAGALFQLVLRNPLASPTTLGISAGAHLALVVATLAFPSLIGAGRDLVALAGSAAVASLIMALGARRGFSPLALVLAGLVVSLWCGSMAAILGFLNDRSMTSLFIWGAGSLATTGWDLPVALSWKLGLLVLACLPLIRPLGVLDLGESTALSLGVNLGWLRFAALAVAVALSALVTSAVGVIGFVGLMAPVLARLLGARRPGAMLVLSGMIGAWLLLVTDAVLQILAGIFADLLPTGAVTAVLGSPLLLLLLPRLKTRHRAVPVDLAGVVPRRPARALPRICGCLAMLAAILVVAVLLGRNPDGSWQISMAMTDLRLPRMLTALAAGAMLAVAGVLLQRLTGNEMASPEVMGIGAGAVLGMAAGLFLIASPGQGVQLALAAVGAFAVLVLILVGGRRAGLAPERVLLAGIALSALVDALTGLLAATGDPRALVLLRWMAGSTYNATASSAILLSLAALILIPAALLSWRWLTLLPLGTQTARSLGVPVTRARLALFALAGVLGAAATLGTGPISFVGLLAPHLARELGLARTLPQLTGAALAGGGLMVLADWLGRMVLFPWQVPAGLVAAMIGAPFLIILLLRKVRR